MPVSPNLRKHPCSSSSEDSCESIYYPPGTVLRGKTRGGKQKSLVLSNVGHRSSSLGRGRGGRGRGRGGPLSLALGAARELRPSALNQVPSKPTLLSVEDLVALSSQFEPRAKALAPRPRVLHVQLHSRRSFTEAQLWAIIYHRYDNLTYFDRAVNSYAQIADLLHL